MGSRGNYKDWKKGPKRPNQAGKYAPGTPQPPREYWQLVEADRDIEPTLVYRSKEEAERHAASMNERFGRSYVAKQIDVGKSMSIRPVPVTFRTSVPDPQKDIVYRINQTQAVNFSVTESPGADCFLNFVVREDGQDKIISIDMPPRILLELAEHIFGSIRRL